jgi:hypothetical protein
MTSLLVTPKNFKELQLLKELLGKMNVSNHELSLEEKEDLGLSIMMKKVDRSKKVPRETIMKKLK